MSHTITYQANLGAAGAIPPPAPRPAPRRTEPLDIVELGDLLGVAGPDGFDPDPAFVATARIDLVGGLRP